MRLSLTLTAEARAELDEVRRRHPKPYLRERATALLRIADGASAAAVADHGLLVARHPDTVRAWVHRYLAEGLAGLAIRPGRGRPPAFGP